MYVLNRSTIGGGVGGGYNDYVPGEVTKTAPYMILYMVGKLAPNSTHFIRGLIKYVPGGGIFSCRPLPKGGQVCDIPPINR